MPHRPDAWPPPRRRSGRPPPRRPSRGLYSRPTWATRSAPIGTRSGAGSQPPATSSCRRSAASAASEPSRLARPPALSAPDLLQPPLDLREPLARDGRVALQRRDFRRPLAGLSAPLLRLALALARLGLALARLRVALALARLGGRSPPLVVRLRRARVSPRGASLNDPQAGGAGERVETRRVQLLGQAAVHQRLRVTPVGRRPQQRVADPPSRLRRRRVAHLGERLLGALHERLELHALGAHRLHRPARIGELRAAQPVHRVEEALQRRPRVPCELVDRPQRGAGPAQPRDLACDVELARLA